MVPDVVWVDRRAPYSRVSCSEAALGAKPLPLLGRFHMLSKVPYAVGTIEPGRGWKGSRRSSGT
jgi:hypothetical protein